MIERMTKLMDMTNQSTRMTGEVRRNPDGSGLSVEYRIQLTDEVRLLLEIIKYKKWQMEQAGFTPKRVYMSFRTKRKLAGGLYTPCVLTTVPHGRERRDTVLGLDIYDVSDMPDDTVDIGCD